MSWTASGQPFQSLYNVIVDVDLVLMVQTAHSLTKHHHHDHHDSLTEAITTSHHLRNTLIKLIMLLINKMIMRVLMRVVMSNMDHHNHVYQTNRSNCNCNSS